LRQPSGCRDCPLNFRKLSVELPLEGVLPLLSRRRPKRTERQEAANESLQIELDEKKVMRERRALGPRSPIQY